jgi:hypothetical protein
MSEKVSIQKIGDGYGIILPEKHLEFVEPGSRNRQNEKNLIAGTTMRNYYAALKQIARI